MCLEVREEVVACEEGRTSVLERSRACRPGAAIEERELAEELARPHDRNESLLAELARKRDLHSALENHVKVRPRIVFPEDHLAAAEGLRADPIGKLRKLAFRKAREEGKPPQVLGHALLGHSAGFYVRNLTPRAS